MARITERLRPFAFLISILLFGLAAGVLFREVRRIGVTRILDELQTLSPGFLLLLGLLTAAGYLLLSSYEILAFRYIGNPLPRRKVLMAALIGYGFSNSISMTPSLAIRSRLYAHWGLKFSEMSRVFVFHYVSTWVGFLAVGGTLLLLEPEPIASSPFLNFTERRMIGAFLWGALLAYLLLVGRWKQGILVRGIRLKPPSWRILLSQIVVAVLDWSVLAWIPYLLIARGNELTYLSFLSAFLLAQALQIASHVPGGLGVFEGALLLLLRPLVPPAQILSALIVYRVLYTFLPLALASLWLLEFELRGRKRSNLLK